MTEEDGSLNYGRVELVNLFIPSAEEKKRFQSADVVSQIIKVETSIEGRLREMMAAINTAEHFGRGSEALTRLKKLTEDYAQGLEKLTDDVNTIKDELIKNVLDEHHLSLDRIGEFNVSDYQFTAIPDSGDMNYTVSDLFAYGEVASFSVALKDVTMTGKKSPRKAHMPSRLMIELWGNDHHE